MNKGYKENRQLMKMGLSYHITLPKGWCKLNGLAKKDTLSLVVTDNAIVVATSEENADKIFKKLEIQGSD